ncbi:MAG: hypothetical protein M0R17_07110 [Candidatus Omnitrophica bacterium]|jgi:ABC-type Na+ efflux pump permease subunit|nr:hypothetical protein [Candidatus Omnitrophota bacterium]
MNYNKICIGITIATGYTFLLLTVMLEAVFNMWKSMQPIYGYIVLSVIIVTMYLAVIPIDIDGWLKYIIEDIPMLATIIFSVLIIEEMKIQFEPNSTLSAMSGFVGVLLMSAYFVYMGKENIITKMKGGR